MAFEGIFPDGNGWSLYGLWNLMYFAIGVYLSVLVLTLFGGNGPMR